MAVRRQRWGAEQLRTLGLHHTAGRSSVHRDDVDAAAAWRRPPPAATIQFPSGDQASCGTPKTGKSTSLRWAPLTVDMSEITQLTHHAKLARLLRLSAACDLAAVRGPASRPVASGIRREPPDVR